LGTLSAGIDAFAVDNTRHFRRCPFHFDQGMLEEFSFFATRSVRKLQNKLISNVKR
jgi:hypothetical protein